MNFSSAVLTSVLTGLDPHEDTPVEILHVVLLGFIKYFWRDMVRNQVNDEQKIHLIQRLNSVDVQGLGISRLSGETLVNYAGSLTGRDFRVIAQVAPFVIFDLVPDDVFEAWLALSELVPLLWQPVINDINEYSVSCARLLFLICTDSYSGNRRTCYQELFTQDRPVDMRLV